MVRHVAAVAERLALRRDHVARVPDGVARGRNGLHARHNLLAVLDEDDAIAVRQQVPSRRIDLRFHQIHAPAVRFVGPVLQIGLRHIDLRVRENALAAIGHQSRAVIGMRMGQDHGIDVLRLDAGGLQVGQQLAAVRSHHLRRAGAGIEQNHPVAGIQQQHVLLQREVVDRKIVVAERLDEILFRKADEHIRLRRPHHQRSIRDHRRLERADLEPVDARRLHILHRRLGERRRERHSRCKARNRRAHQHISAGKIEAAGHGRPLMIERRPNLPTTVSAARQSRLTTPSCDEKLDPELRLRLLQQAAERAPARSSSQARSHRRSRPQRRSASQRRRQARSGRTSAR